MGYSTTPLLGMVLPVDGTEVGAWGYDVNNGLTTYIEAAVAGTNNITITSSDVMLSLSPYPAALTQGAGGSSNYAILLCSGAMTAARNINLPNTSNTYIVINNCTGGFNLQVRGVTGPTTGVPMANGETAFVVWGGTDFVKAGSFNGAITPTSVAASGNVSAGGQFSGLGTGLTGTAAGLSIGGTAANATTAATANALNASNNYSVNEITIANASTYEGNEIGWKTIPQNAQNSGYTCVISDSGKQILMQTTGAFTIPANASVAYPIGTAISFANASGGSCTIPITTDTMYLAGLGTTGTRTLAATGLATALKITATSWLISGAGLT